MHFHVSRWEGRPGEQLRPLQAASGAPAEPGHHGAPLGADGPQRRGPRRGRFGRFGRRSAASGAGGGGARGGAGRRRGGAGQEGAKEGQARDFDQMC